MENKKVKVSYLRWEMVPVYREKYVDIETIKNAVDLDEDEIEDFFEKEVLGDEKEFIWTSEGVDSNHPDWKGELDRFYIKHNEHSIYVSSIIEIDGEYIISKSDNQEYFEQDLKNMNDEFIRLDVVDIKSLLRDKKIKTLLEKK